MTIAEITTQSLAKKLNLSVSAPNEHDSHDELPVQLIDVREPSEHAERHIASSKIAPLSMVSSSPTEIRSMLDDRPIVLYCEKGIRSRKAAQIIQQQTSLDIVSLQGGIQQWIADGLPTVYPAATGLPLSRQVLIFYSLLVCVGLSFVFAGLENAGIGTGTTQQPLMDSGYFWTGILMLSVALISGLISAFFKADILKMFLVKMPWNS